MQETTIRISLDIHNEDALDRYRAVSERVSGLPEVLEVTEEVTVSRPEFSFVRMQVRHQFASLEEARRIYDKIMDLIYDLGDFSLVDVSEPLSELNNADEAPTPV